MAKTSASKSKSPDWKELVRLFRQSGQAFYRDLGINPNCFTDRTRQVLAAEPEPGSIPSAQTPAPGVAKQTELTLDLSFDISLSIRGHLQ